MSDKPTVKFAGVDWPIDAVPDELTFKLLAPIPFGKDEEITEISLCEPNAGEFETYSITLKVDSTTAMIKLVAQAAARLDNRISPPLIKKLRLRDFTEMSRYMAFFM